MKTLCFCDKCGGVQEVTSTYISPCGTIGYYMECRHIRMIAYVTSDDDTVE